MGLYGSFQLVVSVGGIGCYLWHTLISWASLAISVRPAIPSQCFFQSQGHLLCLGMWQVNGPGKWRPQRSPHQCLLELVDELSFPSKKIFIYTVFSWEPIPDTHKDWVSRIDLISHLYWLPRLPWVISPTSSSSVWGHLSSKLLAFKILVSESAFGGAKLR